MRAFLSVLTAGHFRVFLSHIIPFNFNDKKEFFWVGIVAFEKGEAFLFATKIKIFFWLRSFAFFSKILTTKVFVKVKIAFFIILF